MLLCNAGCLEHIGFQLLQRFSGIHHQKSNQKHSFILALQFLQKRLCVFPIGSKIGGDDVDVISGTNRFFLFLNLAAIQFCNGALNSLNGLVLVYRLDVHRHNLAGFHIQKILQQLVTEVRSGNGEKTHRTVQRSHLERLSTGERKAAGRNKILHRQSRRGQPLPIKIEFVMVAHVEHGVHQVQPFLPVQRPGRNAQATEVIEQVCLNVLQPGFCLLHGFCFNAEGQIFGFGQTIVAALQLLAEHLAVFLTYIIEAILTRLNLNPAFKALHISSHIHKGQLKVDGAVKEVQEAAPFLKNGSFVLLLSQLIVDVLKLNGFCVIAVTDPADAVREHPLKRDRLLCRAGNTIIPFCLFNDRANLLFLPLCQSVRQSHFAGFCPFFSVFQSKQYAVPPVLPTSAASAPHSNCWSDKAGLSGE